MSANSKKKNNEQNLKHQYCICVKKFLDQNIGPASSTILLHPWNIWSNFHTHLTRTTTTTKYV